LSVQVTPAVDIVDHLLIGVADLDRGIDWVEERTGVRAAIGGSHPGVGTRNALLSLGARHYLEIIAPDPAQDNYSFPVDVRPLIEPRLVTWAASIENIEAIAAIARARPAAGSRRTPSGKLLQWRTLGIPNKLGTGAVEPVPFFIEWAAGSTHPSQESPIGCELLSVQFQHPYAAALAAMLKSLGIQAQIFQADAVRITATVKTPKGVIEFS